MDISKELEAVQKKVDDLKKRQENIQKLQDLQDKQNKQKGIRPFSHSYEMN
tara:strand:+ start:320 stop:472 length:153 start_codon:yes stop_codon:yes gene_type:complete